MISNLIDILGRWCKPLGRFCNKTLPGATTMQIQAQGAGGVLYVTYVYSFDSKQYTTKLQPMPVSLLVIHCKPNTSVYLRWNSKLTALTVDGTPIYP